MLHFELYDAALSDIFAGRIRAYGWKLLQAAIAR